MVGAVAQMYIYSQEHLELGCSEKRKIFQWKRLPVTERVLDEPPVVGRDYFSPPAPALEHTN